MKEYCSKCLREIREEMYETGMEQYCKCQCTLDSDFEPELWGWKRNE